MLFGRLSEDSTTYLVAFEAILDSTYQVISVKTGEKAEDRKNFPVIAGHALALAKNEFKAPEKVTYNTVVLPEKNGNAYVYVIPAQPATNVFYLGADFRYKYDSQKRIIVETKKLHNSINTFDLRKKPSATTVSTAVITSIPTETDVFYAMSRPEGATLNANHFVIKDSLVYWLNSTGIVEVINREEWEKKIE